MTPAFSDTTTGATFPSHNRPGHDCVFAPGHVSSAGATERTPQRDPVRDCIRDRSLLRWRTPTFRFILAGRAQTPGCCGRDSACLTELEGAANGPAAESMVGLRQGGPNLSPRDQCIRARSRAESRAFGRSKARCPREPKRGVFELDEAPPERALLIHGHRHLGERGCASIGSPSHR